MPIKEPLLRHRLQAIREARKNRPKKKLIKLKPPRYDDVYYQGVKWLDSQ
jgi:hypothetical protein